MHQGGSTLTLRRHVHVHTSRTALPPLLLRFKPALGLASSFTAPASRTGDCNTEGASENRPSTALANVGRPCVGCSELTTGNEANLIAVDGSTVFTSYENKFMGTNDESLKY